MTPSTTLQAQVSRGARWRPLEYAFWSLPCLAYFVAPDHHLLFCQIAILALFALSLDLIFGYAGVISLGHAAFFGAGAYSAALLSLHGPTEPLLGLLVAGVVAAVLGFLSSFLLLRGNDLTRLMVTLGVAQILYALANQLADVTGGVDGLAGLQFAPILGQFEFDFYGRTGYAYAGLVLFALFYVARRLVHSPFGQSLRGIRQNPRRMASLGVSVDRRLVCIYTVGAAYAGIAGALLVQTHQFVSLEVLDFQRSAEILIVLVLGGAGHLYGGLIGAVVYVVAHDWLSDLEPQYWSFWLGLALVVLVLSARGGLHGLSRRLWRTRRHRERRTSVVKP